MANPVNNASPYTCKVDWSFDPNTYKVNGTMSVMRGVEQIAQRTFNAAAIYNRCMAKEELEAAVVRCCERGSGQFIQFLQQAPQVDANDIVTLNKRNSYPSILSEAERAANARQSQYDSLYSELYYALQPHTYGGHGVFDNNEYQLRELMQRLKKDRTYYLLGERYGNAPEYPNIRLALDCEIFGHDTGHGISDSNAHTLATVLVDEATKQVLNEEFQRRAALL